jgi:hypothetical protein
VHNCITPQVLEAMQRRNMCEAYAVEGAVVPLVLSPDSADYTVTYACQQVKHAYACCCDPAGLGAVLELA